MRNKLRNAKWYPYAVALGIAVILYVVLTNIGTVMGGIRTFFGYFRSPFLGCVMAYLLNPLAKLYHRKLFRKIRKESVGWSLSVALTVVTLLIFLVILIGTLLPQLVESISMLVTHMDDYLASAKDWLQKTGLAKAETLDQVLGTSGGMMNTLLSIVEENLAGILDISVTAGKGVVDFLIAVIVSVYLLAAKTPVRIGTERLFHALLPEKRYQAGINFLQRCDGILIRYINFTLLDTLLLALLTAIFMACFGMQYVGLVALVVGVTNLIPTFGPLIGYIVGGFVLLLVNPTHALIFIIFSLTLQLLDGYVIRPKLFGNTLGVSGLLILATVLIFGSMFGILGMLLAIPLAAIIDFSYREVFLPALESRRAEKAVDGKPEEAPKPPEDGK